VSDLNFILIRLIQIWIQIKISVENTRCSMDVAPKNAEPWMWVVEQSLIKKIIVYSSSQDPHSTTDEVTTYIPRSRTETSKRTLGSFRKLHSKKLHNLCSSPNVIRIMKSSFEWTGYSSRGEMIRWHNVYSEYLNGRRVMADQDTDCKMKLLLFMSMGWDYISELRLPSDLLFITKMIYEKEPWWNDIDRGKPNNSEKNLSQRHFVHQKSLMDWPGPPLWKAGD
jgi:hypothetical protein